MLILSTSSHSRSWVPSSRLAYPKRLLMVCCIVLGGAALLEIAQTLTPDRHGTLIDAVEKIVGGAVGIALVKINPALPARSKSQRRLAGLLRLIETRRFR